jgi:hypothetical protein
MESVHVCEANSEVLVFLDKNTGDREQAIKEAIRILSVELIHERINNSNIHR